MKQTMAKWTIRFFLSAALIGLIAPLVVMPALAATVNSLDASAAANCSSASATGDVTVGPGETARVEVEVRLGTRALTTAYVQSTIAGHIYASGAATDAPSASATTIAPAGQSRGSHLDINLAGVSAPCYAEVRVYVNGVLVARKSTIPNVPASQAPPPPPSLWLANVCEPYDNGAFNANNQMTFGADGTGPLWVGPSRDGLWTALEDASRVVTRSQLEGWTQSLGLSSYRDLWFQAREGTGSSEPRLLSSMIIDRMHLWGSDCQPVP